MTCHLFLAIPLSKLYLDKFGELAEKFNIKEIRWTKKENLHITVLFLGDVKEENIDILTQRLKGKMGKINPFSLKFDRLVFAPPHRPARMIWAQLKYNIAFSQLVKIIYGACRGTIDIKPPYEQIPHITLARFKGFIDVDTIKLQLLKLAPLGVSMCFLMESVLTFQGPTYEKIAEFELL